MPQRIPSYALIGCLFLAAACTDSGSSGPPPIGSGGGQVGAGGAAGKGGASSGGGAGRSGGLAGSGSGASAGSVGASGSAAASGGSGGGAGASAGRGGGGAGAGGAGGSAGTLGASGEGGSDDGAGGVPNAGLTSFKLVVLGSSTAAGEGASSSSKGWVSLLASALSATVGAELDADNLAVGGYTTEELLPDSGSNGSIDEALEREPNLVIVALAGNNDLSSGVSTSAYMSRLEEIRDASVDAGVPVFFMSTAPKDVGTDDRETLRDWGLEMEARFSSCFVPGRASPYTSCFIDVFEPLANDSLGVESEYGAGDGIHLNDAGHAVIFEAAFEIVGPYVCSMTECG